ncbi:MAG TPA: hypothetical protein ENH01_03140 [Nitrospirae bacterium]|nr:hypothetical protein [Nitrospirota bacterium]
MGKALIIVSVIFSFIELVFPIWGIILTVILMRKGLSSWKAWGIVSSSFVVAVYLIGMYIGYNLGAYLFIFLSAIPDIIYETVTGTSPVYRSEVDIWFWTIPPVVLIVIPMIVLFLISKLKRRGKGISPRHRT